MHKKKFKWTMTKIALVSFISLIVLAVSLWGILTLFNKEEPKKPIEKEEEPQQISVGKEQVEEKSSYENLLGLDYTLLRAEQIKDEAQDHILLMDIQMDKPLDTATLQSLGKEAHSVLSKELEGKGTISSVSINLFTNKEGFEKTKEITYAGGYVEGLAQSYSSTHINGNKALIQNYESFKKDKNIEEMDASLDFEVVDSTLQEQERTITADVIMTGGTKEQTEDMIESIIAMLKEKNEAVHVNLNIYDTQKNYADGKLTLEYSTLKPDIILQQTHIVY